MLIVYIIVDTNFVQHILNGYRINYGGYIVEITRLLTNALKPRFMHYGRILLEMAHVIQVCVTTQKIFLLKINKRRDRNGKCIT